jgi:1-acyl-sn-glycerol-3-phosphate acyltransferase
MKEEFLIQTGKIVMGCYARLLLNLEVLKLTEFPRGAKIFAANHPTTTDPFFLGLLTREPMRILVTANAFEVPVFKEYLRHAGHIPVERGKGTGSQTIARAVGCLEQGKTIGIFPEGALSPEVSDGFGVLPAHSGVARIALQTGRPVIPVGIALEKHGIHTRAYQFSDRDATGRWVMKGAYVITVGTPLYLEGDPEDRSLVREAASRVTDEIRRLAASSEERMKQRRMNWKSFISTRNFISMLGE